MSDRKAFNFYRSYYEIASELDEESRGKFLFAILQKQFEGIEPNLEGMAKFAYISQKHSIDAQVKGYEDKTGSKLAPKQPPTAPPTQGAKEPPYLQEKGQEQEKEKVQGKEQEQYGIKYLPKIEFKEFWNLYDKKVDKNKSEKKWDKLRDIERQQILEHLPKYIEATPDKKYRKNPLTYLNSRTWEDEDLPTAFEKEKSSGKKESESIMAKLSRIWKT